MLLHAWCESYCDCKQRATTWTCKYAEALTIEEMGCFQSQTVQSGEFTDGFGKFPGILLENLLPFNKHPQTRQ